MPPGTQYTRTKKSIRLDVRETLPDGTYTGRQRNHTPTCGRQQVSLRLSLTDSKLLNNFIHAVNSTPEYSPFLSLTVFVSVRTAGCLARRRGTPAVLKTRNSRPVVVLIGIPVCICCYITGPPYRDPRHLHSHTRKGVLTW